MIHRPLATSWLSPSHMTKRSGGLKNIVSELFGHSAYLSALFFLSLCRPTFCSEQLLLLANLMERFGTNYFLGSALFSIIQWIRPYFQFLSFCSQLKFYVVKLNCNKFHLHSSSSFDSITPFLFDYFHLSHPSNLPVYHAHRVLIP